MDIESNLAYYRQKRGLSAIELAKKIEVSRQTIYAMETGTYVPNTAIALKLARVLDVSVEDLFRLNSADAPAVVETAELIPSDTEAQPGLPVQICEVGNRLIAMLPAPVAWGLPPADAVLLETGKRGGKAKIQFFNDNDERMFSKRLLIAGCDPAISVLIRQLNREGVEAVAVNRNSSQSLELLKKSMVHVAGTHLKDDATGESNLPAIKKHFPKGDVAVVSYAFWEEGIVIARGNPKDIKGIEDIARDDVTVVNREPGSGIRQKIDSYLNKHHISASNIKGYENIAPGHLPAAWQVKTGAADCCIATKTAANVFGLDFIMLERERYDLVIRKQNMNHPGVQVLLDVLGRAAFRRELDGLGGYDTSIAGDRLL